MFTCVSGRYAASTVLLLHKPPGGADSAGAGQLRGDRVSLQWRNQYWQSLEEGAGKRCSERVAAIILYIQSRSLRAT